MVYVHYKACLLHYMFTIVNYLYPDLTCLIFQLYTVVQRPDGADINTTIDRFCSNLEDEIKQIPYFKWVDVDLVNIEYKRFFVIFTVVFILKLLSSLQVFFPICAAEHYYTICFRFSTKSIVVIDNSKNGSDEDITINYGSIPETVVSIHDIQ